jgi:thiol:disulfide interchange protein DsbD
MRFLLIALVVFGITCTAHAKPVQRPHIEAELISEVTAVEPATPFTVALRLKMDPHWHTYWKNPGDSGLPTRIEWKLPPGFEAGPIDWPAPRRIDVGPLANYGFEGEVLLLTEIRPPASLSSPVSIDAKAYWLVCEEICIPGDAPLSLVLPAGPAAPHPRWASAIASTRAALPRATDVRSEATLAGNEWLLSLPQGAAPKLRRLAFFPEEEGWISHASPQQLTARDERWQLRFEASPGAASRQGPLKGVLVAEPGFANGASAVAVSMPFSTAAALPAAPQPATFSLALATALGFAFMGGLLLNLMPCVFPIVSIKVLGFAERAGGDAASLRNHGLLFALGVVVCFWIIASLLLVLRAGGSALGWGYQLQSPVVIAVLAVLFFAIALNLSGLYHIGPGLQRVAGSMRARSGYGDAFLSGLLATVVATPCTAPFMGAALGFALTQPVPDAMLTFTALALGMAAPYVLLSFSPQLVQRLPKPGAWMETLKQLLAFPLYLTVVWLVWVLGKQMGLDAAARLLAGLVLIAAGLWTFGRFGRASASARYVANAAFVALIVAGGIIAWPTGQRENVAQAVQGNWRTWSSGAVAQAQSEGKAVFVDFTAAWCVTCQVNKRLVLDRDSVQAHFASRNVVLMRADWTNQDPQITGTLRQLGRSGVPVYALYPPGSGKPILLPELLTEGRVIAAVDQVTAGQSSTTASK